jgi:hypothetical protein
MNEPLTFRFEMTQERDYEFRVKFDVPHADELLLDEPEPLGHSAGPNAARLIGAAVANCLSTPRVTRSSPVASRLWQAPLLVGVEPAQNFRRVQLTGLAAGIAGRPLRRVKC